MEILSGGDLVAEAESTDDGDTEGTRPADAAPVEEAAEPEGDEGGEEAVSADEETIVFVTANGYGKRTAVQRAQRAAGLDGAAHAR
jgi:hypothetical protein